jgi:tetratricopeptide (TPR) repeat protein
MKSACTVLAACFSIVMGTAAAQVPRPGPPPGMESDAKVQAQVQLNRGVEAFKSNRYDEAADYFQHAKELDPTLINARLYLATTYASQYIPGAPNEENLRNGEKSVEEFRGALVLDPGNLSAIDGIGTMLFQMAGTKYKPEMFLESRKYYFRHIELKPDDAEPYYWIGLIDWTLSYRADRELRGKFNEHTGNRKVKDTDALPVSLRTGYARDYGAMIEEGILNLKKAIALRADYDDAMAYLNLMYRRKADMVMSAAERTQLLKMADDMVEQVMEIKHKRASEQQ